ncbi:hypothetical protein GCM10007418_15710 [Halopseudomonas salina]|uniref:Uncharacterized protein n=1 Tax=Halopseudomonas salina TaxID=1323744 RepID=A0ABQ1PHD0_9GAMM|nr:hypothetical protein GCM10007418_15710 [Halopseudomonas salina]
MDPRVREDDGDSSWAAVLEESTLIEVELDGPRGAHLGGPSSISAKVLQKSALDEAAPPGRVRMLCHNCSLLPQL